MELALGAVLGLIILVVAWNLRRAFFNQSDVWKEKVDLSAKESKVELQDDYKELLDKVAEKKSKHDNKWYKMSDIDELMK